MYTSAYKSGTVIPIWITKYVLTLGIVEAEGIVDNIGQQIKVLPTKPGDIARFYKKGEWWDNRADAVKQANKKRKSQIVFLMRKLKQLEVPFE